MLLLFIYDLICFHTQEAQQSEQPAMEPQHDQLRRERVDRDLKTLLATCSDECVCQVERCSLRSPNVRFRDLQGETSCGPDGSRCALCKTFCQQAAAQCGLLDTSGALHLRASDCSAAQQCMPFTVQHCPTPCPQNREWDASSELRLLCARCWIASETGCPVSIKWDNCQRSFQGSCVCSSWAATLCSGSRCGSWAQPWANKWVGRPRGQCWPPCDKGCRKILPGGPISPPIERPPHRSFHFCSCHFWHSKFSVWKSKKWKKKQKQKNKKQNKTVKQK